MNRIGIIVTDPSYYPPEDPDHDTPPLLAALRERGADAQAVSWRDTDVDWASYDLLVIRSPWDYVGHAAEFSVWLRTIEATSVPLYNDATLIRWNMDKRYLEELSARGVGVVPTRYLATAAEVDAAFTEDAEDAEDAADTAGEQDAPSPRIVVKPTVGAGSSRTGLFEADDPAAAELARDIVTSGGVAMLQAEVPELSEGREKAVYLVGGRFTHAIAKGALLAPGGGFLGGVYQEHPVIVEATPDEKAFAVRVFDAVSAVTGSVPLYGRIDMVETAESDGRGLLLLEAELFEPAFNLHLVPEVAATFAEAILDCLPVGSPGSLRPCDQGAPAV